MDGYLLVKGCLLELEVADTVEERTKGLMGRSSLPPDRAMLFTHPEEAPWPFWMLNTLIPLDVVWIDRNQRVVDVRTMVPEPGVPRERLTIYQPRASALHALEMTAGLAARLEIRSGEAVQLHLGATAPPGAARCSERQGD